MKKGKQYKNVYTILEKVKKGEIQSKNYYQNKDGLFGKLNFYKKNDLIKPYIHYIDEHRIENIVEEGFKNQSLFLEFFELFKISRQYTSLPEDARPTFSAFMKKATEMYDTFPTSLKYDVHKMYYHQMDKLEFEERNEKNFTKYKFLEKANNPVSKIMTQGSNLKSSIFTRNIMMYYAMRMAMMHYNEPEKSKDVLDGLNETNQSEFNGNEIEQSLDTYFNSSASENMLEKLIDKAKDTCHMIDKYFDQDIQDQLFNSDINDKSVVSSAGKLSPEYIKTLGTSIDNIKLTMGSVKDKIKKLLDKSVSYFSAKSEVKYEDLFNADNASELNEYELLHPKLRKLFAEDIMIKEEKKVGKIDVYVDISGSMDTSCGIMTSNGKSISKLNFVKSMIFKLKQFDMLNEVYLFNTKVIKYKNDIISISLISSNGGTSIDIALQHVVKNNTNALIITDAEDQCYTYSEKAFFIGVKGARFTGFQQKVREKYVYNDQLIVFDGERVYKVDESGLPIT